MPINNHDDTFDSQSLRSLFEQTQPERKDVDIKAIVSSVGSNASEQVEGTRTAHFKVWSSKMRLRAAAVVTLAAGILGLMVMPVTLGEKVAFAQVKERIDSIRTVDYVETSYDGSDRDPNAANDLAEPTLEEAIKQLKLDLKTADSKLATDLEFELKFLSDLQTQNAKVFYVRRVRVKGKHLERTDQLFPTAKSHVIRDALSGLTVAFHDDAKRTAILTKQVVIDKTGGQQTTDIPRIPARVDFFARFTSVPNSDMEQLPSRMLNSKKVVGLRSSEEHDGKTWTRTYWIDPETRLPIEMTTELRRGSELTQRWVMNQFVYDSPMDDELFSTATPEGYSSGEGTIYGLSPK